MIVTMSKVFIAARQSDRERLLEALRELGVVHIEPVDPTAAMADEETTAAVGRLRRAIQILSNETPSDDEKAPQLDADAAAGQTLEIQRRCAEREARLATIHRLVEQLDVWGDVRLEQFEQLRRAGIDVAFYTAARDDVPQFDAEVVQPIRELSGRRVLLAVIQRDGKPTVPESAEPVELPKQDRPALLAEAAELDKAQTADATTLTELAHLTEIMEKRLAVLEQQAEWTVARRSALNDEDLVAIQGWSPADDVTELKQGLADARVDAAVQALKPDKGDQPPTLIRYPRWVKPIDGLMKILGIHPGYHELDITAAFMVALPVFSAMLISDGGYGLLFVLPVLLFYRKMVAKAGRNLTHLTAVIGVLSIIWGVMTGSFFGVDIMSRFFGTKPWIPVTLQDKDMKFLMLISFTIGAVHLSIAQLWRAIVRFPRLAFLGNVGWAIFLWGMYGVVCYFVLDGPVPWVTNSPYLYLLIAGGTMAILFAAPSWNIFKMVGLGLANFPLSMLGTFSDIMSYVRLMAVGLAGSVLAVSFNQMAADAGPILAVPILIFGHGLNVGLCLIALFAHGVRLNVLEFSNNIGMEWSGYSYQPFSQSDIAGE